MGAELTAERALVNLIRGAGVYGAGTRTILAAPFQGAIERDRIPGAGRAAASIRSDREVTGQGCYTCGREPVRGAHGSWRGSSGADRSGLAMVHRGRSAS